MPQRKKKKEPTPRQKTREDNAAQVQRQRHAFDRAITKARERSQTPAFVEAGLLTPENAFAIWNCEGRRIRKASLPFELDALTSPGRQNRHPNLARLQKPGRLAGSRLVLRHTPTPLPLPWIDTIWRLLHGRRRPLQGEVLPCPLHGGVTLRIWPDHDGEVFFRCHECGFCLPTVRYVALVRETTVPRAAEWLRERGVLPGPPDPDWMSKTLGLGTFLEEFDQYRGAYDHYTAQGVFPPSFGEWSLFDAVTLARALRVVRLPPKLNRSLTLVRLSRNLFGRPIHAQFFAPDGTLRFRRRFGPGNWTVVSSPWSWFCDWTRRPIFCLEEQVAMEFERSVALWPEQERPALLWVDIGHRFHRPQNLLMEKPIIVVRSEAPAPSIRFPAIPGVTIVTINEAGLPYLSKPQFDALPHLPL